MGPNQADIEACLTPKALHLILMPTEACNFRCVYCYEDFRLKRMAAAVVRGVKNLLAQRAPRLDQLSLSWFGGEPLLARDLVVDILSQAAALRRRHRRLKVFSDMTTNAFLLSRPVFEELLGLGVTQYQVTFDGPPESHDRKRIQANGRPTFERIWRNLEEVRAVPGRYRIVVRLHVDAENIEALPRFIDSFGRTFGGDARFELFLRRLSRLGGPNDGSLPVFDAREAEVRVDALKRCAAEQRVQQVSFEPGPLVCYAARGNSLLVRADGRLAKCTVALDHPMNDVGRLHEDGSVELAGAKMLMWMRGVWSRQSAELECPMRGYADPPPAATRDAAAEIEVVGNSP
jgi:uncharacterized protein